MGMSADGMTELVERCRHISRSDPMTLFVGSGLSTSFPAALPATWDVVKATAEAFSPSPIDSADEASIRQDIVALRDSLPEPYYEALMTVYGQDVVQIWEVLNFWHTQPSLQRFNVGPNAGHYAVVVIAYLSGTPVVTPNYDELLEAAASNLGLRVSAYEAGPETLWLIKTHGTTGDPSSIATTLRRISVVSTSQLALLRSIMARTDRCFVGYSGRDMDFFPQFCQWSLTGTYWLSLSFPRATPGDRWGHGIHLRPEIFRAVMGSAATWGTAVLTGLASEHAIAQVALELIASFPEVEAAPEVGRITRGLLSGWAHEVADRVAGADNARRRLAHALGLRALGLNAQSERSMEILRETDGGLERLPLELQTRADLLSSSLAHESAKYGRSQRYADMAAARLTASRGGALGSARYIALESRLRATEALRMQHFPLLPVGQRAVLSSTAAWATGARVGWDALHPVIRNRWLRRRLRRGFGDREEPDPSEVRAVFEFIEHLVRLGTLLQGLLKLLRPNARLGAWWSAVGGRSDRVGYAEGRAHAMSYSERTGRVGGGTAAVLSAEYLFTWLGLPTGQAKTSRDKGNRYLAASRRSTGSEREGLLRSAQIAFGEGLRYAALAGDPSLELKCRCGVLQAGGSGALTTELVETLLARIEGDGYRRVKPALLAWVVKTELGGGPQP